MRNMTCLLCSTLAAVICSLLLAAPVGAVQHEVRILMDLDHNPTTGCTVPTVAGSFDGVEQILITTVVTSSPPETGTITDVARSECVDAITDTFGALSSYDGSWSVGIGNGEAGRDVVETYFPLIASMVPNPSLVRICVVVTDEFGGEKALLTVDGMPGGEPIILKGGPAALPPAPIPALGGWGLMLLALLLAAASVLLLRRHRALLVAVALVILAVGTAWAAVVLDGLIDDWTPSDLLASDGIVLFGNWAPDSIFFRVDMDLFYNMPPVAQPDAFTTDEDTQLAGANVLVDNGSGTDADPYHDIITVTGFDVLSAQGAAVSVAADGSLNYDPRSAPALQAKNGGDSVMDTFSYTIEDPFGLADTATVTVAVLGANDPPDAVDDPFTVEEDSTDNPLDVLANDTTAPDAGETLTITGVGIADRGGTANTDGSAILYTPAANFAGVETFTYTVSDGNSGTDMATVVVTVQNSNPDSPVCGADSAQTDENSSFLIEVLSNDSDPDPGQTATLLVLSFDSTGTRGMVTNNGTDVSYDPNGQFESLGGGQEAMDVFSYTTQDADGFTCMATVTVTITGVPDPP